MLHVKLAIAKAERNIDSMPKLPVRLIFLGGIDNVLETISIEIVEEELVGPYFLGQLRILVGENSLSEAEFASLACPHGYTRTVAKPLVVWTRVRLGACCSTALTAPFPSDSHPSYTIHPSHSPLRSGTSHRLRPTSP
jgi:hypothetical protein